jgi:hypothetical protein
MKIYHAFVDPSGGSSDSMTLAIAHRSMLGKAICDGVWERRAPFRPSDVVAEFVKVLESYGIATIFGDRYSGEWVREAFREHGIDYQLSQRTKSEIFSECLALINSGRAKIPADKKLRAQLLALERHTSRSGKDAIDHPPGGHDDVVNSVCGALLLAVAEGGSSEAWACYIPAGPDPDRPLPNDWRTRPPSPWAERRMWRRLN